MLLRPHRERVDVNTNVDAARFGKCKRKFRRRRVNATRSVWKGKTLLESERVAGCLGGVLAESGGADRAPDAVVLDLQPAAELSARQGVVGHPELLTHVVEL